MQNASNQEERGGTRCHSKAGTIIGSDTAKVKTATPDGTSGLNFSINGLMYYLADTDDFWTLSGDTVADLSECMFLLCVNTGGTMSIVQGTAILTADLTSGKKVLDWPAPVQDTCPLAALRVTTSGGTFIPGTTALNDGTITDTYYDFDVIPPAPLTA